MVAYTYLIGWSAHDKWYYGVRWAKGCQPSDLWTSYFTSSSIVKKFREENGEPDVIEVRRCFDTVEKARLWEGRFLQKIKAAKHKAWLNANDNLCFPEITPALLLRRGAAIKRGWDSMSALDRLARIEKRRLAWQEKFEARSEESKQKWRAASAERMKAYNNGNPETIRSNARAGQAALAKKLVEMTDDARLEYEAMCANRKREGFEAMSDKEREAWSAAKKLAWAAKSAESIKDFKERCSEKRKIWHDTIDPGKRDEMKAAMSLAGIQRGIKSRAAAALLTPEERSAIAAIRGERVRVGKAAAKARRLAIV